MIPTPVRTSLIESAADALNVRVVPIILPVTGIGTGVTVIDPEEYVCETETTYDVPLPDTIVVPTVIPVPVRTELPGSVADELNVSVVPEILPVTDMAAGTELIVRGCQLETTYDVLLPD
jgi:hypothetical protein